jgi:hypothetical protein
MSHESSEPLEKVYQIGELKAMRINRSDEDFVRDVLSKPEDAVFRINCFDHGNFVDTIYLNKHGYLRHFGFESDGPVDLAA